MKMLDHAIKYAEKGFSVFPIQPNDKKKPYFEWLEFQKRKPTEDEIKSWWLKYPNAMIGVATGKLSNIFSIDTDTPEAEDQFNSLIPESVLVPTVKTPRGLHHHFQYTDGIRNSNNGLLHIRGEGGYIIMPPSKREDGSQYKWQLDIEEVSPPIAPPALLEYIFSMQRFYRGNVDNSQQQSTLSTSVNILFGEHRKDEDLFHTANCLVKGGMQPEEISQILKIIMDSWGEGFDDKWRDTKIKSALLRAERKDRNLTEEIREWIMSTNVNFLSTEVEKCLHLSTREDQKTLSVILKRFCEQGLIKKYGNKRGSFIPVLEEEEIDWLNADETVLDIEWPGEIHKLVETMPKNIVIVAGEKGAGKTAFLINTVYLNMDKYPINYLSSEMPGAEWKKRLRKFGLPLDVWKRFKPKNKSSDFAESIKPNEINIIDFLEVYKDFYEIGSKIREIYDKLDKGIGIIAIQKNPGVDIGLGGYRGMEKARLYITIGGNRLKIISGKFWVNGEVNPNGLVRSFKLIQGAKFNFNEGWEKEIKK